MLPTHLTVTLHALPKACSDIFSIKFPRLAIILPVMHAGPLASVTSLCSGTVIPQLANNRLLSMMSA